MSDREELEQEAREERYRQRRGTINVYFKVSHEEEFIVPAMPGLTFTASYEAYGDVTPDISGDHVTPNGPPEVEATLGDVREYEIQLDGCELPKWLQEHLAIEYAGEMDAAFLEAIGGQDRLDQLAIEKAQ